MSVDHQRLNLTYRKEYLALLSQHLCDVDSCERCVVGKINNLLIAYLTVDQNRPMWAVFFPALET